MPNPIYQSMMNKQPVSNGPMGFFQALQQLKSTGGDPNQRIQQMLNSGQVTQEQYNAAVEKAKQLQSLFGK